MGARLPPCRAADKFSRSMSDVERLFSEPPGPTVVNCDWCGSPAIVCAVAERHVGGTPARLGFCEEHHRQLLAATTETALPAERAAYNRRRSEREAELRRQRSDWRRRKAASQAGARNRAGRPDAVGSHPGPLEHSPPEEGRVPLDSEELVAAILQGERPVSPVATVDPRLEDPAHRVERLQEALWPLVRMAEECGIYVDCNPSQGHSVMVVGEIPVRALFQARDLLKRER